MDIDAVLKASINACTCETRVFCVLCLPAQQKKKEWLSVFMYLSVIENSTMFVVICVTRHITVLCVCASGT